MTAFIFAVRINPGCIRLLSQSYITSSSLPNASKQVVVIVIVILSSTDEPQQPIQTTDSTLYYNGQSSQQKPKILVSSIVNS